MGQELNLAEIYEGIKAARVAIGAAATNERVASVEASINELFKAVHRPGFGRSDSGDSGLERKDARDLCVLKHSLDIPKNDGHTPAYEPSSAEIDNALMHRKALRSLFRHGNIDHLDPTEKKSLTSFSFGSNDFILPPQMSDRVLSCLVDPTDVAGLMGQAATSGGSLKFLIDQARMADAAWGCDATCFANNPQPDLAAGLGEMEIKVEPLRFIVCATTDLLQDASFNIEQWTLRKAEAGFRRTINAAVIAGDGIGKPAGILNPNSGIPICDTAASTPAGTFTWQDLLMLKMEIPQQWLGGGSYFMNQNTFALLLTMSDANGRPLFGQLPSGLPGFMFAGSPIQIVTQMPNVAPGTTPVAFGNWKEAYVIVNRMATTMLADNYSAGWCVLFKFSARIGGAVACPNAARLLRVR